MYVPDKSDTLERKQYFTVNGSKMYWMAEYVCSHLATLRKNNHFKWPFFGLDLLFPLSSIYVPSIWPLNDTQQPPIHQWRGGTFYNISLIFPWDVKSTMPLGKDYKYHFHFHKKSCLACCIRVLVRKLRHFYGLRPKSTLLHIFPSSSKYSDVFVNEILLLACISQYDPNPPQLRFHKTLFWKKY